MRACRVGISVVAVLITAHSAEAQQGEAGASGWSVGLARGLDATSSGRAPGFEHNEEAASLLFEWRRPKSRFGIRLELARAIHDNRWSPTGLGSGCAAVSCFTQSEQTTTSALLGASYEFRQGRRLRPYLLLGGGVQNAALASRANFTCAGVGLVDCSAIEGAPTEFRVRDFYPVISGGAGLSLNLGRFSAFTEGRLVGRPLGGDFTGSTPPLSVGVRIRPDN